MATLNSAREKWERKMSNAGSKWKDGVSGKQGDYEQGVADFLGTDPGNVSTGGDWEDGVSAVSASDFQSQVAGKGDKWARRTENGMTR